MASNPRKTTNKFSGKALGPKKISAEPATNFSLATKLNSTDEEQLTLLERDMRLGRATWNKYVLPVPDFGTTVFKELFHMYPDYEMLFIRPSKKGSNVLNTANMKTLMNERFTTKVRDIMESLDNPQELNDIMTKLGLYHAKLGLTRKHFEDMKRTIILAVKEVMNKPMQYDEEEALNKCLAYAFRIAVIALEDYQERQQALPDKPSRMLRTLSTSKKNVLR